MKIRYLGHSCFLLEAKNGTRIVTDPYTGVGYEMPRVSADFVTCSHFHFDHNHVEKVAGAKEVIVSTGMRERGGINISGLFSFHDEVGGEKRGENTVFLFEEGGVRVCHMGDIGEPLRASLIDRVKGVDVLLIPVGGVYTIDAAGALEYIQAINPTVTIAMHYRPKGGTLNVATQSQAIAALGNERCIEVGASDLDTDDLQKYKGKILFLEKNTNG